MVCSLVTLLAVLLEDGRDVLGKGCRRGRLRGLRLRARGGRNDDDQYGQGTKSPRHMHHLAARFYSYLARLGNPGADPQRLKRGAPGCLNSSSQERG